MFKLKQIYFLMGTVVILFTGFLSANSFAKDNGEVLITAVDFAKIPPKTQGSVAVNVVRFKEAAESQTFISSGIPFAQGQLQDEKNIAVFDKNGTEIAIATKVLARWPQDKSIRSILVQTNYLIDGLVATATIRWGDKRSTQDLVFVEPDWKYPTGMFALPARWLSDSQITGEQLPMGQNIFRKYDQNIVDHFSDLLTQDWQSSVREGGYYSTAHVFYQLYARTGDTKYFLAARRALLHYRDNQLILSGEDRGVSVQGKEPRYVYVQALVDDYLFTGDPRSFEIAGYMAEYLTKSVVPSRAFYPKNSEKFWTERLIAFPFLGAVSYYELTQDPHYLKLSDEYMLNLHKTQLQWPDRGGFIHNLYAHDSQEGARRDEYGGSPFMTGLLLEAIIKYHQITNSPIAADSIFRALDWLIKEGLDLKGDGFKYLTADKYANEPGSPDLNLLIVHAFGYGYRLSGYKREDYLEIGQKVFQKGIKEAYLEKQKQFNQNYRSSGHYLAYIQDGLRKRALENLQSEIQENQATFPASQGKTNVIGWSDKQQTRWQRMFKENHPFWQNLKIQADGKNYGDQGMRDGLVYLITGDKKYAMSAWRHNSYWCGRSYKPIQAEKNPKWCETKWKGLAPRNATRDQFVRLSLLYSWVANGLPEKEHQEFRDVLDRWVDLALNVNSENHGTRMTDTDEQVGHYFGLVIYALAIAKEDPTRSEEILEFSGNRNNGSRVLAVGGVDATGANYETMRNTIASYAKKAKGGQWVESTEYNLATLRYLLVGVDAINNFYGEDKFPEVTAMYDDIAVSLTQELTPDFRDAFQWGDTQNPHDLKMFNRIPLMSAVSGITGHPWALFLFDYFNQSNLNSAGEFRTVSDAWHMHADPYSKRYPPTGQMSHNAQGMGIAYWHEGWSPKDSFFASKMINATYVDHDWETLSNFNLFRNGQWVITNPKGYYGGKLDHPWMNGLMINGGISRLMEASGQSAYQAGANYMYHAGATAGQLFHIVSGDPPPEFVHEWNRSLLYLHNDDKSDTVIIFDRVNSCNPLDTKCMSDHKFGRLPDVTAKRIKAAGAKHQWIVHMYDPKPVFEDAETISWQVPGGERAVLKTFIDGYTKAFYDERALLNKGAPLWLVMAAQDKELHYQLRLIPERNEGFMSLLNVVHVGSRLNAKQIKSSASSPEKAQGLSMLLSDQQIVAMFNATYNEPPKPTPVSDKNIAQHDSTRLARTIALRYFNRSFDFEVDVTSKATVYIMDLNPTRQWQLSVDGKRYENFTVSDQGVAIVSFEQTGTHNFEVSSISKCDKKEWQGCDTQKECSANGWYWHGAPEMCHQQKGEIIKVPTVKKEPLSFDNAVLQLKGKVKEILGR